MCHNECPACFLLNARRVRKLVTTSSTLSLSGAVDRVQTDFIEEVSAAVSTPVTLEAPHTVGDTNTTSSPLQLPSKKPAVAPPLELPTNFVNASGTITIYEMAIVEEMEWWMIITFIALGVGSALVCVYLCFCRAYKSKESSMESQVEIGRVEIRRQNGGSTRRHEMPLSA